MSRQSWILLALCASVAVNLLVVGVFLGRSLAGPPPGAAQPPMNWAARDLDPGSRRLIGERLREKLRDVRPLRAELRAIQGEVRRAATAEDFDPQAMRAALARLREVTAQYQQFLHDNVVELAAELPRAERLALLRATLERSGRGGKPAAGPPPRNGPGR